MQPVVKQVSNVNGALIMAFMIHADWYQREYVFMEVHSHSLHIYLYFPIINLVRSYYNNNWYMQRTIHRGFPM